MRYTLLLSILIITTLGLKAQEGFKYSEPSQLEDGWAVGSLASQDIEVDLFKKFIDALNQQEHDLHSMLVIRNNVLVFEEYFGEQEQGQQHDLRSVTKSITSLLLGIAVEKGFIKSVNDPVQNYLEEFLKAKNPDPRKESITIRDYLTMSSGMDCDDWNPKSAGQEDKLYKKKNWIQTMANLPMINEPGSVSTYCTAGTILIAEIIERSSGMSLSEFANEHLFEPMNISNVRWGHTNRKPVISSGRRLYMTPRDMAKLGQLVINKGKWGNQQLIPEAWITEIGKTKTQITGLDYSYLWWQLPFQKDGQRVETVCATGNGGQYILAFPNLNMVAIFTGGAYNSPNDKLPFSIVNKVILPATKK